MSCIKWRCPSLLLPVASTIVARPVRSSNATDFNSAYSGKAWTVGAVGAEAIYSTARQTLIYAPELGRRLYEELLKLDPFYEERWYWHRDLGIAYYSQGAYREAAVHYERAVRLKPKNSELYRFAGDAYFYEGRWALALERYESALSIEPVEAYFLDTKLRFFDKHFLTD